MRKKAFLESIRRNRRQLERYIFYFKKNEDGEFVSSDRLKFGQLEMLEPGVYQDWSLKDLLSHLVDWQNRFLEWTKIGMGDDTLKKVPDSNQRWDEMDPEVLDIPFSIRNNSLVEVLNSFKETFEEVMFALEQVPGPDLFNQGCYRWTGDSSLADYAALVTSHHDAWAKSLIRSWRKTHAGRYLNKEVILERIATERRRLEQNINTLTVEEMVAEGVVGDWTVKDLMAHLAAWEQLFLSWYQAGLLGDIPSVPAEGFNWNQLDGLNQAIYETNRDDNLEKVQKSFKISYLQVLETVKTIPEKDMFAVGRYPWLGEGNLVSYILANTANHYRWAKEKIRSVKK